jgi:hypothetical protein
MQKNQNRELLKKLVTGEIHLKDLMPKSWVLILRNGKKVEANTGKEIPEAIINRSEISVVLPENGRESWNKE